MLSLLVAVLVAATPAHAWTRTSVDGLRATANAQKERVDVALDIDVHVHGGWLEKLDIAGANATHARATITRADGTSADVTAEVDRRGAIVLSFGGRRESPRRGVHKVHVEYTLVPTGADDRFEWSLPAWDQGIDAVSVAVTVPRGMELAHAEDGAETTSQSNGDSTTYTATRAYLPTATAWSFVVRENDGVITKAPENGRDRAVLVVAALVGVLAVLRRVVRARARGIAPVLDVRAPVAVLASVVMLAAVVTLGTIESAALLVLVVALALDKRAAVAGIRMLGTPLDSTLRKVWRREKLFALVGEPFDLRRPFGATLLASLVAAAFALLRTFAPESDTLVGTAVATLLMLPMFVATTPSAKLYGTSLDAR